MPKNVRKENLPKHVYRKRLGVLYFYRKGEPSHKFECQDSSDPEFMMEYALLLTGKKQRLMKQPRVRNMGRLVQSYIESARYRNLGRDTVRGYDEVLEYLKRDFGHTKPQEWRRRHIMQMRDTNQERHHFANYTVTISRILFEHAIDLGWLETNPARGVPLIKSIKPPRTPWPYHLIEAFRQAAGTTLNGRTLLVFELCLATGQRIQDVLDFKWTDIRPIDGTVGVDLIQNKTGKSLWVPLRDSVVTLLTNSQRKNEYILTNHLATGPWSYRGAAQAVQDIRKEIGAENYDIHSLRYSAACDLALAGLDDETIGAVTGQCLATVQHYTRSVRQMANAKRAIQARETMLLRNGT